MGWSHEMQEFYPEGWAKTLTSLRASKRNKGKKQSEFQKQRVKEANIGNKHALGKHWKWSDEARKKIIGTKAVRLGMKSSITTRKKQSNSLKGWTKRLDPEKLKAWKEKIKVARAKQVLPLSDTRIELDLQHELTQRSIVFVKHIQLPGLPDIFIEPNICIFADGDYWHANPSIHFPNNGIRFGQKILTAEQIWEKDANITKKLTDLGYKVFRFWESEILDDVGACIDKVLS